ncbi:MAG: class I SAM-dependent methyltransferase [bacterium]
MVEKGKEKFDGIEWLKRKGVYVGWKDWKERKIDLTAVKNMVVLNAGCGSGTESYHFHPFVKKIYTIDINEKDIREGKEKYKAENLFFEVGDIEQMPFKDSTFDIIYTRWVVEHLKSPRRFIDESYRILKEGGILMICTSNIKSSLGFSMIIPHSLKLKILKILHKCDDVEHYKCYYRANSIHKLDKLCKDKFKRIYLERFDGEITYCRNFKILTYLWFLKHKLTNNKLLNWTHAHFFVEYEKT